jgi:hypothetical protein
MLSWFAVVVAILLCFAGLLSAIKESRNSLWSDNKTSLSFFYTDATNELHFLTNLIDRCHSPPEILAGV